MARPAARTRPSYTSDPPPVTIAARSCFVLVKRTVKKNPISIPSPFCRDQDIASAAALGNWLLSAYEPRECVHQSKASKPLPEKLRSVPQPARPFFSFGGPALLPYFVAEIQSGVFQLKDRIESLQSPFTLLHPIHPAIPPSQHTTSRASLHTAHCLRLAREKIAVARPA
ncbi:hypothetical protein J1614_004949 [Plenodomus biglobosus]|nr:hypothetical protein J1614_004949 [Plenodomus biglobosus]